MKKFFCVLLIINLAVFSMENSDEIFEDESEQKELPLSSPPGTLPNYEAYSLIECLKPGDVLLSKAKRACLHTSSLHGEFPVVSYQSGRYQDAFYFVPKKMAKDAEQTLSLFSKTNLQFYAYLIPIENDDKFIELARKTSAGCADKGGKWSKDVDWQKNWKEIFGGSYLMLDRARVAHAAEVPSQRDDQKNGDWSCGPNSGYRFLRSLGEPDSDYETFVDSCPRSISKMGIKISGVASRNPLLWLLGAAMPSDVGPRPRELAAYITSKMKEGGAQFIGYNWHLDVESALHNSLRFGYPTIVLLVSGSTSMHYVVVIGVKPLGKYIRQAVILNTNGAIGVIPDDRLRHWMDSNGYANWPILESRFNTIQFCCSCCMSKNEKLF